MAAAMLTFLSVVPPGTQNRRDAASQKATATHKAAANRGCPVHITRRVTMNAHLPAHLDSMKAPPQRDAVHAAFLRASQDGKALTAESEWRRFLGELLP